MQDTAQALSIHHVNASTLRPMRYMVLLALF